MDQHGAHAQSHIFSLVSTFESREISEMEGRNESGLKICKIFSSHGEKGMFSVSSMPNSKSRHRRKLSSE